MVDFLLAAALATATVPAPTTAALPDASPAIWVVNDHDTVIYLFGTFHALDGSTDWFNDEVRTAFNASDELVLETIIPRPTATGPAPRSDLRQRVRGLGVTPSASTLASTQVGVSAGQSGSHVDKGADEVLRNAAEDAGKSVRGLETFQAQLDMFARLPAPQKSGGSPTSRKAAGTIGMPTVMGWMQTAWNRGDQSIFTNVVEQMRKTAPATYRMMFTERNTHWAAWIADRMERPGTVFVAVGAGHLAGMDSVQAKLADIGIKSERIN